MAKFTAEEDESLLLLVALFDDENAYDVDWNRVQTYMQPTSRTVDELKLRFHHLLTTNTTLVHAMPEDFLTSQFSSARMSYTPADIYKAIDNIFGHLTKADVRQPKGKQQYNTGEIAPVGVTAILEEITLTNSDIFIDIGSGVGCILTQVVLQSNVRKAIGLEIQGDLAQKSRDAINRATGMYPRLFMVQVITGDIKSVDTLPTNEMEDLAKGTVLYSNNKVFEPMDNNKLLDYVSGTFDLRLILLTDEACPRCSENCTKRFCESWIKDGEIEVTTCWGNELIKVFKYKRRPIMPPNLFDVLQRL